MKLLLCAGGGREVGGAAVGVGRQSGACIWDRQLWREEEEGDAGCGTVPSLSVRSFLILRGLRDL